MPTNRNWRHLWNTKPHRKGGKLKSCGRWAAVLLLLTAPMAASESFAQSDRHELRVAVDNFWDENLDPTRMTSGGAELISLMYDNLLRIKDGQVVPGIADEWEAAEDGSYWTFHLRDDVFFHDGTKMTAEDVAYSYERAVSDGARDAEQWRSIIGAEPRIEIIDDRTIRIYTQGPKPFFAINSAGTGSPAVWIVPKAYIEEHGQDYFEEHPIGTGAYKFVSRSRGDVMQFEAWDHWSGVVPEFQVVTIYLVPEEATRVGMLRTGALDATRLGRQAAGSLAEEAGFTIVPGGRGVAFAVIPGSGHQVAQGKPLSDIRVRQALSLAINRQEIIDTLLDGLGGMPPPHRLGLGNPDMPQTLKEKWQAWATENYVYDPELAKALIAEAGYQDGFSFTMWTSPDSSADFLPELGVVLVSYWEQIGAHPNFSVVDAPTLSSRRHSGSSTEMLGEMLVTAADTYRVNTIEYLSHFTSDRGSYDLLVGTPEQAVTDALWAEGQSTMDPARYEEILDGILTIGMDKWVGIPIVTAPVLFAFGPRVAPEVAPTAQFLSRSYADFKYTGVEQ